MKVVEDAVDATFHSTRNPWHLFSGSLNSVENTPQRFKFVQEQNTMSRSTDPGHFFQTDASESSRARKAAKSGNKNGNPILLQSKILNAIPDPSSSSCIYIAESAGCVRKVDVEVGTNSTLYP